MSGKLPPVDGRCLICGARVDEYEPLPMTLTRNPAGQPRVKPTDPFPDAVVEELHAGRDE